VNSLLIPLRPHLFKYLTVHLGECYFLSESDHFGIYLFNLLRRPLTDARQDHVLEDEEYEQKWELQLGSYGSGRWGFKPLTGKSVHQFNTFVHSLVIAELHGYVESAVDHGQQAKFAIEGFMGKYGFEETDIQFATLQKSWTRYWSGRKASKKKVHSLTGRLHLKQLEKRLKKLPPPSAKAA
jgi:hypothetical protein